MNTWIAVILRTEGAKASFLESMDEAIAVANNLDKVETLEQLHRQRGIVTGLRSIKFVIENSPE